MVFPSGMGEESKLSDLVSRERVQSPGASRGAWTVSLRSSGSRRNHLPTLDRRERLAGMPRRVITISSPSTASSRPATRTKKRQGGRSALPKVCRKLFAIGQWGPPSGHPRLLKRSSLLASLRIVVLSQDCSAALTSAMICCVLSGKLTPHALSSADIPI
jgi:hypothetical protein